MSSSKATLNIDLAGASHVGKQREKNEDAYAILPGSAAVLADGMGGLARGREAADLVTGSVLSALKQRQSVEQGIESAHRCIEAASLAAGGERMGSTAVVLTFAAAAATVHWVGDSRAYLWRHGELRLLTRDHSVVEDLIEAGSLSRQQAETHPNRHVLTRAVGIRDAGAPEIETRRLPLQAGDRLLLCTDGLHGYLPQSEMIAVLTMDASATAVAERLIERTLRLSRAGDNITVVCGFIRAAA